MKSTRRPTSTAAAHLMRLQQARELIESLRIEDPETGVRYPVYERVPGTEEYRATDDANRLGVTGVTIEGDRVTIERAPSSAET